MSSGSGSSNPNSPYLGPDASNDVDDSVQIDMAEIAKKLNLPERTVAMKIRAAASLDHDEHDGDVSGSSLPKHQSTSYSIRRNTLARGGGGSRGGAASASSVPAPSSFSTPTVSPQLRPSQHTSIPISNHNGPTSQQSASSYVGSLKATVDNLGSKSPHQKHFVLLKRPSMLGDNDTDVGRNPSSLSDAGGSHLGGGKTESSLSALNRGNLGYLAVRKGSNLDPSANTRLDPNSAPDGDTSEAYLLAAPQSQQQQQNSSSGFISLRRGDKRGSVVMSVHDSTLGGWSDDNRERYGGDASGSEASASQSGSVGGGAAASSVGVGGGVESDHLLPHRAGSTISGDGTSASAAGPEGSINDSGNQSNKKPRKQVHFPEDVVNQIVIIHRENSLVMQVEYNRPPMAYVGCLLSVILLVVAWCQISKASFYTDALTGDLHRDVVARSVAVVSCLSFLSTAVVLVVWCIAIGVPSPDERDSLQHYHHRRKLAICTSTGAIGLVLMASSFMLHISSINFVVYSMWPLIFSYLWNIYKVREISRLDAIGLILSITGTAIMIIGEVHREGDFQPLSRRWLAVTLAFLAAIAETLRWTYEKQSRRYFSNGLVMVCTIGLAGIILLVVSIALKSFSEPIGRSANTLSGLDRPNVGLFIGACIAMFAAITTSHASAVYFDTLTMISMVAMSGPLCVLAFGWFDLPTMEMVYRGVGGSAMAVGSFLLIITGFIYRRHVELVFALPEEEGAEGEEEGMVQGTPIVSLRE